MPCFLRSASWQCSPPTQRTARTCLSHTGVRLDMGPEWNWWLNLGILWYFYRFTILGSFFSLECGLICRGTSSRRCLERSQAHIMSSCGATWLYVHVGNSRVTTAFLCHTHECPVWRRLSYPSFVVGHMHRLEAREVTPEDAAYWRHDWVPMIDHGWCDCDCFCRNVYNVWSFFFRERTVNSSYRRVFTRESKDVLLNWATWATWRTEFCMC